MKAIAVTIGRNAGAFRSVRECAIPFYANSQCHKTPAASIWIDMEMTGLKPDTRPHHRGRAGRDRRDLNTVAEAPVWVVHQSDAVLAGMDAWNQGTHGRSGLIDKVKAAPLDEAAVEAAALAFLREHVPAKASPMCGNSICQDRRFLARWMPALEAYFHYRNLDVSTLKELARRWKPDLMKGVPKEGKHEALADVYESIDELKYYRQEFIRLTHRLFTIACAQAARRRRC